KPTAARSGKGWEAVAFTVAAKQQPTAARPGRGGTRSPSQLPRSSNQRPRGWAGGGTRSHHQSRREAAINGREAGQGGPVTGFARHGGGTGYGPAIKTRKE